MQAIISGQSGVALILDGDRLFTLRLGTQPEPQRADAVRDLFADVTDVETWADLTLDDVARQLAAAIRGDRGLQMALILLDGADDDETRRLAASALVRLMADDHVATFVLNRLHAWPLPTSADVDGAIVYLAGTPVEESFVALRTHQEAIRHCREMWNAELHAFFGEQGDTAPFERRAVNLGVFRALARAYHEGRDLSAALQPFLHDPALTANERAAPMLSHLPAAIAAPPTAPPADVSGPAPEAVGDRPEVPAHVIAAFEKTPWDWPTVVLAWLADAPQRTLLIAYARQALGPARREAAEDMVQDAFAFRLPAFLRNVREEWREDPALWIREVVWQRMPILMNRLVVDSYRPSFRARSGQRVAVGKRELLSIPAPSAVQPDEIYARREREQAFWTAVEQLPEPKQDIVVMRMAGFEYSEIGAQLGLTPAAVSAQLRRISKRLAADLYRYRDT